uniref:Reverse transcriptase domain-containing protein n=1 Tax=Tanacetum cinerariifolium TaxID=118510 RepID=A0A6L2M7M6_TANCI|nr:reverse transcriptase domain-containing protein [Tanacetum cinerariifolium]
MSAMANTTPLLTTVTKPATNPRDADATPRVNIQDFCEEYYEDILPIIMDKVRRDKRKEVHARLDFGESSGERRTREDSHYASARARTTKPERLTVRDRLRYGDRHVLDRLDSRDHPRGRSRPHRLDTSNEDCLKDKERFCGVGESYDDSFSHSYRDGNRSRHMKRTRDNESPLSSVSKSDSSDGRTRMPNNVKTYDGTRDPEDHVKIFQVERWAMPAWCHMFNSTLIGAARVWFDELPPESVDSYTDLKAAFLAYFMQQKKYVKDPVEIHNIKQKDGETIEDFMERFKVETGRMEGASECMRISGFMYELPLPAKRKVTPHGRHMTSQKGKLQKKAEAGKYQPPPPMVTPVEKRSSNEFYDFHNDKGHNTDELITSSAVSKEEGIHPENFKVDVHPDFYDQEVAIGGTLSAKGRTELFLILKKNLDIFSWQPSDMTGVPRSVAKHRLNIWEGYSPVRWRMCVDFTDVNKACPQDCYPLPEIDWKVESLCGYPFKCFLDAYKGHHQIQLAEPDEEKTTFHTGQGVYCYTKIPFGLKNAGATYQRLVDKAFDSQIGQNIEVYVDDLVVKSYTEAEMLREIDETFRMLPKINMKLNPKKCTFGAAEGGFLGYVVTLEGIKSCPDKTATVLQQPSPRTIKEVQSLNGKLASLNRFLSKSAEKSLPLFKTLKKCIKKSDFHWTAEAKQAFKQLKQHLSELPLLVAPRPKEELIIYLSATCGIISAVLMTERGATQTPIYFISRALQGPKLNYTPMEKLVLSLVFAAKRLRRDVCRQIGEHDQVPGQSQKLGQRIHQLFHKPSTTKKKQKSRCPEKNRVNQLRALVQTGGNKALHQGPTIRIIKGNSLQAVIPYAVVKMCWTALGGGIDIACPFSKGPGKVKFFIVVMDYFTKWIEAKAVVTITGSQVKKFVWDNIVCRFGLPGEIVTDNGKQFSDNPFRDWCDKLNITQRFASVKHPQSNGLVERANRSLGEGIKARLGEGNKKWVEELPHVLWAHRTMIKSSHGDTPFSLTYGIEAVIPVEIGMPTYRTATMDVVYNDEELRLNLDMLEERRERAAIREAKAKLKMTKYYNARVRGVTFRPGDFVYRSNDASHAVAGGKLGPK